MNVLTKKKTTLLIADRPALKAIVSGTVRPAKTEADKVPQKMISPKGHIKPPQYDFL